MLTVKQNFLETLKRNGSPDRLVNGYEFMKLLLPDPLLIASGHGLRAPGRGVDAWGVSWELMEGQPYAAPYHGKGAVVLEDVRAWREKVVVPSFRDSYDWTIARLIAASANPEREFTTVFFPGGLFERFHLLMGIEGALIALMTEPEAVTELLATIAEYRMRYVQILVENLHPEIFLIHDDWGMKNNLFMHPETWRTFFKPHYAELYAYLHSEAAIVVHHADSFLEPIIMDMVEIGVDVWQGALPQNDIERLQRELDGRMVIMGGIDAAIIDTPDTNEEIIRAEVRRACATYGTGGHFIPCETYGLPNNILYPLVKTLIPDEINRYNQEVFGHSS